jgi:hypothetical protein
LESVLGYTELVESFAQNNRKKEEVKSDAQHIDFRFNLIHSPKQPVELEISIEISLRGILEDRRDSGGGVFFADPSPCIIYF